MLVGFENVQKVGQESMNRTAESFTALSRGWQTLAGETAGYSRQSLESGAAHMETLLGAKSLDGALQAHTEFAKDSFDKAVGQAARFGEIYLDLVRDAVKPFEGFVPTVTR